VVVTSPRMDLSGFIKAQGGTATRNCAVLATLADRAECSAGTLYMIVLGHKQPSATLAGRLSDATDGAVTRHTLLPDVFPAAA
jgi:DNA-binding transcriptional regulator YdaS (Cro superfamily)